MTLTSMLSTRSEPLREWFELKLPNLRAPQQHWKSSGPISLHAPAGIPLGIVGMSFDYRLRYRFSVTSASEFTAARGSPVLAPRLLPDQSFLRPAVHRMFKNSKGDGAYDRFAVALDSFVARVDPVGRSLDSNDEAELLRFCWALALFEAEYRAPKAHDSPLYNLRSSAGVDELLGLAPNEALLDLRQLVAGIERTELAAWSGRRVVANPTFSGGDLVGGADGDIIVGDCLVDVKVTKQASPPREWLYQLIGYVLLDFEDEYGITSVGFYAARVPALVTWNVDALLAEMAGRPVNRTQLRQELVGILRATA